MSTIPHVHPQWCDPRVCTSTPDGVEHRQAPLSWTATGHSFSVGLTRFDLSDSELGEPEIAVVVENLMSVTPSGELLRVEAYLSTADAQLLASACGFAAAQLASTASPAVAG